MIDKITVYEGCEDYDKPLGEIVLNGETVPVRVTFREHDPEIYCIGEILDVDGITGGYNLQFAWSSARAAAVLISEK